MALAAADAHPPRWPHRGRGGWPAPRDRRGGVQPPPQTFEEHEVFDPASGSWETLAPLPSARHGLASVALDGSFYVIGGATLPGAGTFASVTTTVHIFDPEE